MVSILDMFGVIFNPIILIIVSVICLLLIKRENDKSKKWTVYLSSIFFLLSQFYAVYTYTTILVIIGTILFLSVLLVNFSKVEQKDKYFKWTFYIVLLLSIAQDLIFSQNFLSPANIVVAFMWNYFSPPL